MIELPTLLEGETEDVIMQRMLDALPSDIDKSEGSYIWDSLMPVAIELSKIIEWGREILTRGMLTETYGPYLDMKALESGISRKEASYSEGQVTFTGESGTVIPEGTRVATPSDNVSPSIEFETTNQVSVQVNGQVTAAIRAIEPGPEGNVEPGNITIILPGIEGVSSVTNLTKTEGGYDEESDDSLLRRVLEDSQKNEGDGNIDDYIAWSKQISGVGNVLVEPHWNGINTVRVVVLDQNGNAASEDLIRDVQMHLDPEKKGIGEGKAPVGAKVTVNTATIIAVTATIPNLVNEPGYTMEQAKTNGETALRNYLKNINPGGVIRVREAAAEIINAPGVLDTGDILLNGSRNNIPLSTTELGDLGSVTYS
ncbi:baseplate J family protein [Virgibacillus halodenitrificans]|uniref:baseplate J/gp47 family protein n=1 Tax=Virgibacillus halodenitrificans TaxID=1482 RepID=UPI001371E5ED|nr:baseplate J/gp47 family protein [Virgibacillus halodenitrificans]MYL45063.1 baseplate J family protein [Virgibacillus halodenitrificans]